jgi:hypothetical protein
MIKKVQLCNTISCYRKSDSGLWFIVDHRKASHNLESNGSTTRLQQKKPFDDEKVKENEAAKPKKYLLVKRKKWHEGNENEDLAPHD